MIRDKATRSLKEVLSEPPAKTPRQLATEALLANLKDNNPAVRNFAACAILDRQL